MKILNYICGFLVCGSLLLFTACSKDGGNYNPRIIEKDFAGDTYEYLKSKPGVFDSLVAVIDRLGLEETVRDSSITLFALNNQSFQLAITNLNNLRKLSDRPAEYLANVNYKHLDTMMTQYIIRGKYLTDSLERQDGLRLYGVRYGYPMHANLSNLTSSGYVGGGPVIIDLKDTKRSQFNRDWVGTATSSINIKTSNGLVHVINPDHVFGFNDFVSRMTYIPPPPNLFKIIGGVGMVQPGKENTGGPNAIEASKFVFDGNKETKYFLGGFGSVWFQFELNESAPANAYTITSANDIPTRDPIDWNLQGSHDGVDWFTLDSRTGEIFEQRFQIKIFRISNTVSYKFYRLNIIRSRGNDVQFADWTVNRESQDESEEVEPQE